MRFKMIKYFITGCAGFIGSTMVDTLLAQGHKVVGYDNFATGRPEFLIEANKNVNFQFFEGDIQNLESMKMAMEGCDFVFHLAANADIRFGTQHPTKDLLVNTIGTSNVLEAMRSLGIKKIAFASSSAMYGDSPIIPTPESISTPIQTSFYGASKLAGEGLIQAYGAAYNWDTYMFRYVSILGPRYTHGHAYNFSLALRDDPSYLYVLGGKAQQKSYLDIDDCVQGMLTAIEKGAPNQIYNIGNDEYFTLQQSVDTIIELTGTEPRVEWSGNERGWIGDSIINILDITKLTALGWKPKYSIYESLNRTINWLNDNDWIFEKRGAL